MERKTVTCECCIVGGGPAGMMLGLLLARSGVSVVVLEKHLDFLRDFRGDTIHPSTLELLHELGLLDEFLAMNPNKAAQLQGMVGDDHATVADFSKLWMIRPECRFIAFVPQWDFLSFVAKHAKQYPNFDLWMGAEVVSLITDNKVSAAQGGSTVGVSVRVHAANAGTGVRVNIAESTECEVRADLIVGADGRHSMVRELAGLSAQSLGAPMDILWFRLSRDAADPTNSTGRFDSGQILVMLNRGDYWQCGLVIPKGGFDAVRAAGLASFHANVGRVTILRTRVQSEILDWDQVKLLTVCVDRLNQWYRQGVLCIGDAAHAMSPVGGVGINLAIQDAVAAANQLAAPLKSRGCTIAHLEAVQDRRMLPTRVTQAFQVTVQNQVIRRVLITPTELSLAPRTCIRMMSLLRCLRMASAYFIGVGVRPERIRTVSTWSKDVTENVDTSAALAWQYTRQPSAFQLSKVTPTLLALTLYMLALMMSWQGPIEDDHKECPLTAGNRSIFLVPALHFFALLHAMCGLRLGWQVLHLHDHAREVNYALFALAQISWMIVHMVSAWGLSACSSFSWSYPQVVLYGVVWTGWAAAACVSWMRTVNHVRRHLQTTTAPAKTSSSSGSRPSSRSGSRTSSRTSSPILQSRTAAAPAKARLSAHLAVKDPIPIA